MSKYRFIMILITQFLYLLQFAQPLAATKSTERKFFRVNVNVLCQRAGCNDIASTVSSYINRELRSIHDIVVYENDYNYEITIIVDPFQVLGDKVYSIAVILSSKLQCGESEIFAFTGALTHFSENNKLKETCANIVALLDSNFFERIRQSNP